MHRTPRPSRATTVLLGLAVSLASAPSYAGDGDEGATSGLGVAGGVGTDVELGLGYGLSVTYAFPAMGTTTEIGPTFFYHHSSETSVEYDNEYVEQTWLTIFAVRANNLYGYERDTPGMFYIVGAGIAAIALEWEERSEDDPTANDDFETTAAAGIVNVGLGFNTGAGFELRAELPILVFLGETGGASSIAPTLTLMAGYRF